MSAEDDGFIMTSDNSLLLKLIEKGVRIPAPESVEVEADIDPERISGDGVTLHAGTKLLGSEILICRSTVIGWEGPVTVENCQVGPDVQLKGGYFKNAVFLKGSSAGLGAQIREGTIFEEYASVAHTVGLKQTILFPFVTLGSLINFCDCLMAGGTGPKNHSEVGSSYIHFNFTPNQDKATPSLIGDVPRGVMLNQSPVFLGGQGGLVGPCRIAYGTVIAAGTINRKDITEPNLLVFGDRAGKGGRAAYRSGRYSGVRRIVRNNIIYAANLAALMQWGLHVRSLFVSDDFLKALHAGLIDKIDMSIRERMKRLGEFGDKAGYAALQKQMPRIQERFAESSGNIGDIKLRDPFLRAVEKKITECGSDYIKVIQSLPETVQKTGTSWLNGIVETLTQDILGRIDPELISKINSPEVREK